MKTLLRIVVSIMLTYALLSLTNCSTKDSSNDLAAVNDDFENERGEVAEDLRQLRADISDRIQRVGDRMETTSDETRLELSEINEELLQRRERLDLELEQVESSTERNWSDIRQGAKTAALDVKREFTELTQRIPE